MIKTLKISAFALILSVASFQVQAADDEAAPVVKEEAVAKATETDHSAGFDCNKCDMAFCKVATEAEAKQCSDCQFSEIGDFGFGVWRKQCAGLTGAELKAKPICQTAQKCGSKALFGYLAAGDKDSGIKGMFKYLGKIIVNALKAGDSLN